MRTNTSMRNPFRKNCSVIGGLVLLAVLSMAGCLRGEESTNPPDATLPPAAPTTAPAASPTAATNAPVTTPAPMGQRVFTAGHSFHFLGYQLPALLQEIARSAGISDHQIAGTSVIFGSKVIQHWDVKDPDNKTKEALKTGNVDVLTTTPIYLPDDGIEKFAKFGYEHNPNFRLTVQEFWIPFDIYNPHFYGEPPAVPQPASVDHNAATVEKLRTTHRKYFSDMDAKVTSINHKFSKQVVFVVPVGQAVIALREKIIAGQAPGIKKQEDLFGDSLGHPKPPLQALIAYCHYAVIYRQSPVGLPVPSVLKNAIPAEDVEAYNHLIQQLAWDAVIHHPLSGVTGK